MLTSLYAIPKELKALENNMNKEKNFMEEEKPESTLVKKENGNNNNNNKKKWMKRI